LRAIAKSKQKNIKQLNSSESHQNQAENTTARVKNENSANAKQTKT